MPSFFSNIYFNNTVLDYCIFLISLFASYVVIRIVKHFILKRLNGWAEKTKTPTAALLLRGIKKYLLPIIYITAVYLNATILSLNPTLTKVIDMTILAVIAVIGAAFLSSILVFIFNKYMENKAKDANHKLVLKWLTGITKVVIWGIALILFLDNSGVKMNSLIAGLGIGGVALAFAAQTILTDVFCFFTIVFDRPFEIEDFLSVGEEMGTVEHIGVKTTRLRTLSGEQLILSNTDLTSSRIRNYKTMEQRRVLFTIGVTYDTTSAKLAEIPALVKCIIEGIPDTKFARTHFVSYGAYSLNFEIAYYILSSDYDKYMDTHQTVNLRIKEEFDKQKIQFAFPTQTLYLRN